MGIQSRPIQKVVFLGCLFGSWTAQFSSVPAQNSCSLLLVQEAPLLRTSSSTALGVYPQLTLYCARQPWQKHTRQFAYLCWVPAPAVFAFLAHVLVPHSQVLWHTACLQFILISLPLLLLTCSPPFCPMISGPSLF